MKREDINVTFEQQRPDAVGRAQGRCRRRRRRLHRSERFSRQRSPRSFTLPATVDGNRISAAYKDGVLTVRVPQREEAKPKQIEVRGSRPITVGVQAVT